MRKIALYLIAAILAAAAIGGAAAQTAQRSLFGPDRDHRAGCGRRAGERRRNGAANRAPPAIRA